METLELSTNHHGVIAEAIAGRYAGYPHPLQEAVTEHVKQTYSKFIPKESTISLHSHSRDITSETTITTIEGIDLPNRGDWGYSSGWIPDDIISASWSIYNHDEGEYYPEAQTFEINGPENSHPFGKIDPGNDRIVGMGKVYYLIEVKSITTGARVRLTENQYEMMKIVSEDIQFVHPVVVILNLGELPHSVDIDVDIYADSVWGDGAWTKTVKNAKRSQG